MTATAATLTTRAPRAGRVELIVTDFTPRVAQPPGVGTAIAEAARGRSVAIRMRGLLPAHRYAYVFYQRGTPSRSGQFVTPPAPTAAPAVRLVVAGGFEPAIASPIIARLQRERPLQTVLAGELLDADVDGRAADDRAAHLATATRLRALREAGAVSVTPGANDGAVAAFAEAWPSRPDGPGLYRRRRMGRSLAILLLDGASARTLGTPPACIDAAGSPHPAPLAGEAVRTAIAGVLPAAATAPPPDCLAALSDPARVAYGARQIAALARDLRRSTAPFKLVVLPDSLVPTYLQPYDRLESAPTERAALLAALGGTPGLVVVAGGRAPGITTIQSGAGPIVEVTTGRAAATPLVPWLERVAPGLAAPIVADLSAAAPTCMRPDQRGYVVVVARATRLVIALRDAAGRPLCPQLVLLPAP